jgi:hypothetical protein
MARMWAGELLTLATSQQASSKWFSGGLTAAGPGFSNRTLYVTPTNVRRQRRSLLRCVRLDR